MAVDQATRVEHKPERYLAGEMKGGAEAFRATAGGVVTLGKACLQPFTTAQYILDSGAGKALKNFSEHSTEAVETSARDFLDAQNDPDGGGQATGKLLTNLGLAVAPLPIPKRLWGLKVVEEAPKTRPELGGFPSNSWRTHFNHTRPTGQLGARPEGIMEPLEMNDPVKLQMQSPKHLA